MATMGKTTVAAIGAKLLRSLRQHASADDSITVREAHVFFEIALEGEMNNSQIAQRCDLAPAKISTIVWKLGKGDSQEEALGLIESWTPERPRNVRLHKVSAKGHNVLAKIVKDMEKVPG